MFPTLHSACFAEVVAPEQNLGIATGSNEYQLTRKIQWRIQNFLERNSTR